MSSFTDPTQHSFWLASRAVGVIAMILVSISVAMGLLFSGRMIRNPGTPRRIRDWHEAVALCALLATGAHGFLLLGDSYLRPGIAGVLLPFAMAGQPVWTALGVVAGWLTLIVTLTFYVRRLIGPRTWRALHYLAFVVYVLAIVHTVGSGSDARSAWLLALLGAFAVPIVFAATYRFLPAERRARREAAAAAGSQPPPSQPPPAVPQPPPPARVPGVLVPGAPGAPLAGSVESGG